MASLNKVLLIGNLGRDPETRYSADGAAITNITIATSMQWKDKATGDKREETEWHRVAFFGRLAEIAGEYLRKGSQVYVEGRLRTRKWQDKEGQDRYTTEIVADEMKMLGSRQGMGAPAPGPDDAAATGAAAPARAAAPRSAPASKPAAAREPAGNSIADMDEDVPF